MDCDVHEQFMTIILQCTSCKQAMVVFLIHVLLLLLSGTTPVHRYLKREAIPTIFMWTAAPSPVAVQRNARVQRRVQLREQEPDLSFEGLFEEVVETQDKEVAPEPATPASSFAACQTQTPEWPPICIERFQDRDDAIHYYTGLESYGKFKYVLATLGPAAYELEYRWRTPKSLSVENQLFLSLIKLRRHMPNKELSLLFNISEYSVANIFITWVNFMYYQWQEVDIWPDQEMTRFYIPREFKKLYPKTRIILDGMEYPVKKPKDPSAQQATYSTYKNRNTLKIIVGASPGGLVTYIPDSYGGAASDRALVERSDLMTVCDPKDEIMVDKGFNVQDLFAPYDIGINMPTFLKKRNQFQSKVLLKDRKVASKRVHIERIIGLAKTYKILSSPMNATETKLGSEICFVCFMLCNFRTCIVPTNA